MRKNIVIFSSLNADKKLCKAISKLLKNKNICHIPAGFFSANYVDKYSDSIYRKMGFKSSMCLPLGVYFNEEDVDRAFSCDAIHLGGGNTFEFLYLLNARGMIEKLRKFANKGGILMGNSAGGIMMSETIEIASFADPNYLKLSTEEMKSLNLVDFDMKPHWESWEKEEVLFQKFANKSKKKIICLKEHQSIIVTNWGRHYFGGKPKVVKPFG